MTFRITSGLPTKRQEWRLSSVKLSFGGREVLVRGYSLLDFCGGDRRGSCASCWTCFWPGVLGERLAGNVHGAYPIAARWQIATIPTALCEARINKTYQEYEF